MRKYVHWLKINMLTKDTSEQYLEIDKYLKKYKNAKATIYLYDNGSFNKIVRLECSQCYNELDMDVNSMSTNLTRLSSKPHRIGRDFPFEVPKYIQEKINKLKIDQSEERCI